MMEKERNHMPVRACAVMVTNSYLLYTVEIDLIGGAIFILWFVVILWTCVLKFPIPSSPMPQWALSEESLPLWCLVCPAPIFMNIQHFINWASLAEFC